MIEVLRQFPLEAAIAAAQNAIRNDRTDRACVLTFAAQAAQANLPPSLEEPWTPAEVVQWHANIGVYDRLVMIHG
jgi:hypothetical protein